MKRPGSLTAVVLLQMGGPDSLAAVRPFLARLFLDRDLVRLPAPFLTQPLFAWIVSGARARRVRRYYEEIGGGSPIGRHTEAQRTALEAALRAEGGAYNVYVAMRYWHPLAKHAALEMKDDGATRAVVLPLYPQYCSATTGSSLKDLALSMKRAGLSVPVTEIRSYPEHPGYVAALAGKIEETLRGSAASGGAGTHLLFSAHGIPMSLVDAGDPYRDEVERTVAAVMRRFPDLPFSLSYQSRAGRAAWLGPDTVSETERLGRRGIGTLVVVPVSFVSDHIETLHELDIRLGETARRSGIGTFLRVPALNDDPPFILALKDLVLAAAGPPPA